MNIPDPCERNVDFLLLQIEHLDNIIFLLFLIFITFGPIFLVSFLHDKQFIKYIS